MTPPHPQSRTHAAATTTTAAAAIKHAHDKRGQGRLKRTTQAPACLAKGGTAFAARPAPRYWR